MQNLARVNTHDIGFQDEANRYKQLRTFSDDSHKITWCLMKGNPRPTFNPTLLHDLSNYVIDVKKEMSDSNGTKYDYLVLGSDVEGVYNLGGDLDLFYKLIETKDREGLFQYAISCIDVLYQNIVHLECDLTTISLIQGDALGGGLETALASNITIAERGTKLGFPEVLFNLFPGMGAYSMLSRKVGSEKAEEIILSGKIYSAEELYDLGIIEVLTDEGQAELALFDYIKKSKKSPNSHQALRKVRDLINPITYKELYDIAVIWTDAAFKLRKKDIRMMKRLVAQQDATSL